MCISKVAAEAEDRSSTAKQRRTGTLLDQSRERPRGGGGAAGWRTPSVLAPLHSRGSVAEDNQEEEAHRLMARGSGSGRWSRQRMGFLNTMLRCNLPPETQKVVVFMIMMLLIVINVVLMFLLAFQ